MRCLGVVVGTAWLHATRQFLDTSVFLGKNIIIQIRMQQGLSQDARIIRQEVFVEEQGFHHEFDETDQTAWHLVLYENGYAAGCCRLFSSDNPDVYILGRLAVRKSCRGRRFFLRP